MRNYYGMIFPKWMEFVIVISGIVMVMVVGYYWNHVLETPATQQIGQYNGREMTEKIDQQNNNGILPLSNREGEIIVSDNGTTHTVLSTWGVFNPIQTVEASGFKLYVSLYDAKVDSGRVKVTVQTPSIIKSLSIDVGRIVQATHQSTIEKLIFGFSDRDMPPNGAFKVCANGQNCEQADRHGSVSSAEIFVQVP
jgi:hypothetical protein